ncbi:O-antigen ligase family protein [Cycloclasticus pugetii]|uniref:O-antigen ligase family protein n=1 Tax=Cycloclasticus pugetii TaxID=34068 RepID=UPI003A8FD445
MALIDSGVIRSVFPKGDPGSCQWLVVWLLFGVLWFAGFIGLPLGNKIYQQGLVLTLWLPACFAMFYLRKQIVVLLKEKKLLVGLFVLLFFWEWLAGFIQDGSSFKDLKRQFYVLFFIVSVSVLVRFHPTVFLRILYFSAVFSTLIVAVSMFEFYWLESHSIAVRVSGYGGFSHPILGGYLAGIMVLWLIMPRCSIVLRVALASCFVLFIIFSQSRGVWLALAVSLLSLPLVFRRNWAMMLPLFSILITVPLVIYFYEYVISRGFSYRPEIWFRGLLMVCEQPLWGVGDSYTVVGSSGNVFDHAHNLMLHIAVVSGLPALVIWLCIWGFVIFYSWQSRDSKLGQLLFLTAIFSTIAGLFDGAGLWVTPRPEWFLTWLPLAIAIGLRQKMSTPQSGF